MFHLSDEKIRMLKIDTFLVVSLKKKISYVVEKVFWKGDSSTENGMHSIHFPFPFTNSPKLTQEKVIISK